MDNTNFLKIVYFDEAFVADFMQIIAGGELKKTTEFITEVNSGIEGTAGIEGGIGTEKNISPDLKKLPPVGLTRRESESRKLLLDCLKFYCWYLEI